MAVATHARVRRSFASFDTRCALGIGLAALALRLAFVLAYGRTQTLNLGAGGVGFPFSDTFFYSWVGSALSMGDGFTFVGHTTAHWPPGYPFLLAGVYWLFGADTANALIANAVLGALTLPLVDLVGLRALGRPAAAPCTTRRPSSLRSRSCRRSTPRRRCATTLSIGLFTTRCASSS